jgi:hypothetical protein
MLPALTLAPPAPTHPPPVRRFLNRILGLPLARQNLLFK